jgi:hypothetical protein
LSARRPVIRLIDYAERAWITNELVTLADDADGMLADPNSTPQTARSTASSEIRHGTPHRLRLAEPSGHTEPIRHQPPNRCHPRRSSPTISDFSSAIL